MIWFNLSGTLGFQGMRGLLTRDSVKILNRLDKKYEQITYKELSEKLNFPVNFKILQSIILGNLIQESGSLKTQEKVDDQYILKQSNTEFDIISYIHAATKKVSQVDIIEANPTNLFSIQYQDFQLVDEKAFPMHCIISIKYKHHQKEIKTLIHIDHNKIEFTDKPLRFPFNIPNKYERG